MENLNERTARIAQIPLWLAVFPVIVLIALLGVNVWLYGADATYGANQIALLFAAGIASVVGVSLRVTMQEIVQGMVASLSSSLNAILILLLIGGLSGTWMISGVVPAMIYYGLQVLSPGTFLIAALLISSIVSLATGSSWTTVATVGLALIAIGGALEIPLPMVAGAIISGAYFGDKLSPLSDTTNLAPAMAGAELFTHIRYMLWTTIPSYTITIIAFAVLGSNLNVAPDAVAQDDLSNLILDTFSITPWLFLVPAAVVVMILFRIDAATTLFIAMLLGAVVAVVFQPELVAKLSPQVDAQVAKRAEMLALSAQTAGQEQTGETPTGETRAAQEPSGTSEPVEAAAQNESFFQYPLRGYNAVVNAIALETQIPVADERAAKLLTSKGMVGMLNTVWLIVCAMCFGGAMEAVGLLERITMPLVKMAQSTGALIGTTAASCLVLNFTASDQYLAIVVPGRMFRKTFEERGLAPENLSRTLEDAGTVTSVLVPWNTCGAAQSGVLGVATISYLPYCVFNYVSPLMTLFFGAFQIAIAKKINDDVGSAK